MKQYKALWDRIEKLEPQKKAEEYRYFAFWGDAPIEVGMATMGVTFDEYRKMGPPISHWGLETCSEIRRCWEKGIEEYLERQGMR